MKILITGGTGFIGTPTVKALRKNGHELLIISRTGKGTVVGDLTLPDSWMEKVRTFKPDCALLMGWEDFPKHDAVLTAKNTAHTLNMYRFLVEIGCPKVVTLSSGMEYEGMQGQVSEQAPYPSADVPEKHGLLRESRIFLARFTDRFSTETPTVFVRALPFLVYGPGQRSASLLPSVIRQLADGKLIEIKNPALAHDFVFVDDVAEALTLLVEKTVPHGRYNIGSGKLTTVGAMVNVALRAFGKKAEFDEAIVVTGVWGDIEKIRAAVGWSPTTAIEQGVTRMIESFR